MAGIKQAEDSRKMASRWKLGMGFVKFDNAQYGEESSESENETEPVKTFIRKLSTNAKIKSAVSKFI